MPTIAQLVRKERKQKNKKSKSPALLKNWNTLNKETKNRIV